MTGTERRRRRGRGGFDCLGHPAILRGRCPHAV